MSIADYNFFPDALPDWEGDVKIWSMKNVDGKTYYYIDRAYRDANGKARHFRRKTDSYRQHMQNQIDAAKVTDAGSLTSIRFTRCVSTYIEEKGTGGFTAACFKRAVEELGNFFPDRANFLMAYNRYRTRLGASGMAQNTIKNYLIVVRTVCNYAVKMGRCGSVAVHDWGIQFGEHRERILTAGEDLTLRNTLVRYKSPLIPHILFSLVNPIRKSDLFSLERQALKTEIYDGKVIRVVRFRAQKTRRHVKTTTLVNVDEEFVRYAGALPPDCPFLFPIVGTPENGAITKLKPGCWRRVQDSDRHFNTLLSAAGIADFHWHDMKHCAETHMLRQGFTYDQIRKLGIQMSPKTQMIYDNRSAAEIASTVLNRSHFVASGGAGEVRYA